jgi:hypothetical protein
MSDINVADVLKNSVTQEDYAKTPQGGAFFLTVPHHWNVGALPPDINGLGLRDIDQTLSSTPDFEPMWAAAIFIAKTKLSSLAWEVGGDIPLRVKRGQELMHASDMGEGWVSLLGKHLQDYLCTNNGGFIEIVRAGSSMNNQIINLVPLDSLRCKRTGDPSIPVIYTDLKGRQHELQDYEVMILVDEPSPRANLLGMGRCAAARAYQSIYAMYAMLQYFNEKVSGRRPTEIYLINGLNASQLDNLLKTAQTEADAKGIISYMGAIIATIPGDKQPQVASIPLAEIPDGYNRKDELSTALLSYANNIGLDPQDLQPLSNQQIGAGAQSAVLEQKAKGRGLASWRQQWTHCINNWVLPDLTEFIFIEKDYKDRMEKATSDSAIEQLVNRSVERGIITAPQGLQKLVDENVYPKEFLPVDTTPDTTLSDDEKAGAEETAPIAEQSPAQLPAPVAQPPAKPADEAKRPSQTTG